MIRRVPSLDVYLRVSGYWSRSISLLKYSFLSVSGIFSLSHNSSNGLDAPVRAIISLPLSGELNITSPCDALKLKMASAFSPLAFLYCSAEHINDSDFQSSHNSGLLHLQLEHAKILPLIQPQAYVNP